MILQQANALRRKRSDYFIMEGKTGKAEAASPSGWQGGENSSTAVQLTSSSSWGLSSSHSWMQAAEVTSFPKLGKKLQ